jgi:hypothetical protein
MQKHLNSIFNLLKNKDQSSVSEQRSIGEERTQGTYFEVLYYVWWIISKSCPVKWVILIGFHCGLLFTLLHIGWLNLLFDRLREWNCHFCFQMNKTEIWLVKGFLNLLFLLFLLKYLICMIPKYMEWIEIK